MRKSRVIGWMDAIGNTWLGWLREGLLFRGLTILAKEATDRFSHSGVGMLLKGIADGRDGQEESLPEGLGRRMRGYFLCTRTHTVGGALLLYGGVGILASLLSGGDRGLLLIPCAAILWGIPLLGERSSLGWCIAESRLLGGALLGYCGILREEIVATEHGKGHYGGAILFGGIGGICFRLFPWLIPVAILLFCVYLLFRRLPELLLLSIGVGIPFLDPTGHATLWLTAGALGLGVLWWKKLSRRRRFYNVGMTDPLLLLLVLTFVLGGALGEGRESLFCGLTRGGMMLAFFPGVSLLSQSLWRKRFLDGLQIGGGVCGGIGIAQYFFADPELRWVDRQMFGDLGGRVCALFSNPNLLASYLLLLIPLAVLGVMEEGSRRRRLLHGVALGLESGCLLLTWCRGAWLGVMGAVLLLLLIFHRRSAGAFFLGVLPLASLTPWLPGQVRRRFLSIGRTDSSIRYRYALWEGVRRMRRAHPWGIGVGETAFRNLYPSFAVSGTETVMHAHRWFGQIGVEMGWVGVLLLALLLASLGLEVLGGIGGCTERERGRVIALVSCILGFLIMGLFDYVWYHYGVFLLFWLLCACLCAIVREGETGDGRKG